MNTLLKGAVLVAFLAAVGASTPAGAQTQARLVIVGATLIDGRGGAPMRNAEIEIEGSRIVAIHGATRGTRGTNVRVLDAKGAFVIPGLADMHNHLGDGFAIRASQQNSRVNLTKLLALGFTTIHSPAGTDPALAAESRLASTALPRVWGVGLMRTFTTKGGHMSQTPEMRMPETASEAREQMHSLGAHAGVNAIKLMYSDNSHRHAIDGRAPLIVMKPEVMQALIDEAHQQGIKSYVHAPTLQHAKEALRAGADVMVHSIADAPVDAEFIALMKKNKATYISTLALYSSAVDAAAWIHRLSAMDRYNVVPADIYARFERDGAKELQSFTGTLSREQVRYLRENLRAIIDAGIPVLTGTDTGVFGVLVGVSSQAELELMVEAGLTPAEALRTATVNPAVFLGESANQGTVEVGKQADLVILDADPLRDIRNIREVRHVVKSGVVYEPAALLAAAVMRP